MSEIELKLMKPGSVLLSAIGAGILAWWTGYLGDSNGGNEALNLNDKAFVDTTTHTTADSSSTFVNDDTSGTYLYGIDVSHWKVDEPEKFCNKTDSISFVIAKASEGESIQDDEYETNKAESDSCGFTFGAFHFFQSNVPVQAQVDNYMSVVKAFEADNFPPIIDVESSSDESATGIHTAQSKEQVQDSLLLMLSILQKTTGRIPIIYVRVSDVKDYLTDSTFANYPLWICDYQSTDQPEMPGPWAGTKWTLWQRTDKYAHEGDTLDLDQFNGNEETLRKFLKTY